MVDPNDSSCVACKKPLPFGSERAGYSWLPHEWCTDCVPHGPHREARVIRSRHRYAGVALAVAITFLGGFLSGMLLMLGITHG